MVVNAEFVHAYSFVIPGALVMADDTSHAVALQRMLDMPEQEWSELALEVRQTLHMWAARGHAQLQQQGGLGSRP